MSTLIRQSVTFQATPHAIYEALMDSRKHAKFTQAPAKISRKVGGAISAWGDYITGTNLELIPDEKIVQAWHASEWPEAPVASHLQAGAGGRRHPAHLHPPRRAG